MISSAATLSLLSVSATIMRLSDAAVGNYTYQVGDVYGPDNWANLNITDNQCGLDEQSPINIFGFSGSNCDASGTPLIFEDGDCLLEDSTFEIQAGSIKVTLPNANETNCTLPSITLPNGNVYDAIQFHIHTRSEHTIEGVRYPAELHIVHVGESDLAVVGVMLDVTSDDPNSDFEPYITGFDAAFDNMTAACSDCHDPYSTYSTKSSKSSKGKGHYYYSKSSVSSSLSSASSKSKQSRNVATSAPSYGKGMGKGGSESIYSVSLESEVASKSNEKSKSEQGKGKTKGKGKNKGKSKSGQGKGKAKGKAKGKGKRGRRIMIGSDDSGGHDFVTTHTRTLGSNTYKSTRIETPTPSAAPIKGPDRPTRSVVPRGINIYNLVPIGRHFSYFGSLTTPPCTEAVNWIVMEESLSISVNQFYPLVKYVNGYLDEDCE
eukprot:CAMPEP_0196826050 /NCGR_PEP_ID=MMETSP1362-20130617/93413_1 /TAXON_ID=163516 /ORGANISM="Leptocylindrus danicus, Strain CCMP1856" /LENGTH=432 /DNA_ID=CAMNT_0042206581 /DNA_START=316 /DNA_END=1611 /DNA_ORIENTATION=-